MAPTMTFNDASLGMDGELRGIILKTMAYIGGDRHDEELCRQCVARVVRHVRPGMSWRGAQAAVDFVLPACLPPGRRAAGQ